MDILLFLLPFAVIALLPALAAVFAGLPGAAQKHFPVAYGYSLVRAAVRVVRWLVGLVIVAGVLVVLQSFPAGF